MLRTAVVLLGCMLPALGEVKPTTLLTTRSPFRAHLTWQAEQIRRESGELAYLSRQRLSGGKYAWKPVTPTTSDPPPAGWREADFDDAGWARARGPFAQRPSTGGNWPRTVAMLALRGAFDVPDPAAAKDMQVKLAFRGGAIVYVNGKELTRSHLPAGEIAVGAAAEDYTEECFLAPDGKLLRNGFGDPGKYRDRFKKRMRMLTAAVPASMLRKGANCLAIELHRAPTAEVFYTAPCVHNRSYANWTMLAMVGLRLTASSPTAAPAEGLAVWNASPMAKVRKGDRPRVGEPLRPIRLTGCRNGAFSGQFVVGRAAAIRGLTAKAAPLKSSGGGQIGPDAVRIGYGIHDGPGGFFDGLEPTAPAEIAIDKSGRAVLPVWVTVHVPADAAAGEYAGTVTVSADGCKPIEVPVELSVADWALPDSKDYASFMGLVQSPDTLAIRYKAAMWSKEHWRLIDRSFALMGKLGCKTLYLNLLRETPYGNEHSIVRWVRKTDGTLTPDFSIVEKYVETAVKHLGPIPAVVLHTWTAKTGGAYFGGAAKYPGTVIQKAGMPITVLDPATGTLTKELGPTWAGPGIRDFWRPVFDGLREILKKHGLERSMMIGVATDQRPSAEAVADLKAAGGGLGWHVSCHPYTLEISREPVGYLAFVWGCGTTPPPSRMRVYGWANPRIVTAFPRYGCWIVGNSLRQHTPLGAYRILMEAAITSPGKPTTTASGLRTGLRGLGQLGADFWHVVGAKLGRTVPTFDRYPQRGLATRLSISAYTFFSAGRDGPVPSVRYENTREGVQAAEARVFLEKALTDPAKKTALGEPLAARAQQVLDDRIVALLRARGGATTGAANDPGWLWLIGSGWQQRNGDLFAVAAKVAKQLKSD